MRRGILYTFAMFLLASSLLYLVQSLSTAQNSFTSTDTVLADFEAAITQRGSVDAGLRRILSNELLNISQIRTMPFDPSPYYLAFNETLGASFGYSEDVQRFGQFVGSYWSNANVSVNATEVMRPRLYVLPHNITVDHPDNATITFTSQNTTNSEGKILGYFVTIWTDQQTPTLNWSTIAEVPPSDPIVLLFSISVFGSSGSAYDGPRYLNRYSLSQLQLLNSTSGVVATLQINGSADIRTNYSTTLNNIETTLYMKNKSSVYLGENAVYVMGPVEIKGPVGLLES